MNLSLECCVNTEVVIASLIESHSLNYILYTVLKQYGYPEYESLADKVSKIVSEATE